MPRITIDATEATGRDLVEPGPYHMKVHSVSGVEKGPKASYVTIRFDFLDPVIAQKCGPVYRNAPINGKGAGIFIDAWKATTGEQLAIGQNWDVDPDEMVGKEVIANIFTEQSEGYAPKNGIQSLVAAA